MERVILTEMDFVKLKSEIKKNKDKEIVFTSKDDDFNRRVCEKLAIQIILIPLAERKDYSKQRDSGFNQVIAKILKKNNIKLGVSLDELIESKYPERIFARVKQDIMICNKNKVEIVFIQGKNKRTESEIKSIGLALGMPTWMASRL